MKKKNTEARKKSVPEPEIRANITLILAETSFSFHDDQQANFKIVFVYLTR